MVAKIDDDFGGKASGCGAVLCAEHVDVCTSNGSGRVCSRKTMAQLAQLAHLHKFPEENTGFSSVPNRASWHASNSEVLQVRNSEFGIRKSCKFGIRKSEFGVQ